MFSLAVKMYFVLSEASDFDSLVSSMELTDHKLNTIRRFNTSSHHPIKTIRYIYILGLQR